MITLDFREAEETVVSRCSIRRSERKASQQQVITYKLTSTSLACRATTKQSIHYFNVIIVNAPQVGGNSEGVYKQVLGLRATSSKNQQLQASMTKLLSCSTGIHHISDKWVFSGLVPRPLSNFLGPQLQDKIWEWHGNEARFSPELQ